MNMTLLVFSFFWVTMFTTYAQAADVLPNKPKLRDTSGVQDDPAANVPFVFVKGGCYHMGGPEHHQGHDDERPVHKACVSDFYMGKTEVTQGQWEKVMGNNPSSFKSCGPDCPVESVSWNDVQEFIKKLNSRSGKQYRLPTEAEWEYAARSGGRDPKWAGSSDDEEGSLGKFAWYDKNSGKVIHKVGLKKPNGFGLHDMTGNVSEWCQDWYNDAYYEDSPKDNPLGADYGERRVLRGGSWDDWFFSARAALRRNGEPDYRVNKLGFRLVLPAQ